MKISVALYGGSFNPSTEAHRTIGLSILNQLPVNEVWYLVSPQNPFKSKEGMASFKHRVAMAKLNVESHDRLIVQTIENEYVRTKPSGFIETADTLRNLVRDFKDHRFIWTMGADNFVTFHTWGAGASYIYENHLVAVIPRQGYTQAALKSPSAKLIPRFDASLRMASAKGWLLLNVAESDIAATQCRKELGEGKAPACMRPATAHYAITHSLYTASPEGGG